MMADLEDLRSRWTYLYREHLPSLAKARDSVQKSWPVYLDHCFARIILDNVVGIDKPWTEVVKAPAVKHMGSEQLEAAIELGERLATGQSDLVELDERSLQLRGKTGKKRKSGEGEADDVKKEGLSKKAKKDTGAISNYFLPSPSSPQKGKRLESQGADYNDFEHTDNTETKHHPDEVDMSVYLQRIAHSDVTTFRKQMLSLLCQIPRGRYSTYQAMSDYVTRTSHKTCARAVGNAMRNNPFAPEVPCHRVVANDGSLGGFKGYWGEEGKFASLKHKLLHEEGVRFDSRGKVKGPAFREFSL
jgi:methylated-DNA-[protein]-cysteine S-methyltransferase